MKLSQAVLSALAFPLLISFLAISGLITGCSTAPVKFEEFQEGSFSTRARIRNLKTKKTYIVNIDIAAKTPSKLRMEVTTPLGIHLASFALNDGTVSYYLPKQKKYYTGRSKPWTMKPIIGMSLDPNRIIDLLFDVEPKNKTWSCDRDKETGHLSECARKRGGIKIKWVKRRSDTRVIDLSAPGASLQLYISDFENSVDGNDKELFFVKKP